MMNRRNFLQIASLLAASAAIAGPAVLYSEEQPANELPTFKAAPKHEFWVSGQDERGVQFERPCKSIEIHRTYDDGYYSSRSRESIGVSYEDRITIDGESIDGWRNVWVFDRNSTLRLQLGHHDGRPVPPLPVWTARQ